MSQRLGWVEEALNRPSELWSTSISENEESWMISWTGSINRVWFLSLKEASKWLITLTSNINHDISLKKSTKYWILLGYSYVWALHNLHIRYPINIYIYMYMYIYPIYIYKPYSRWLKTHSLPFQSRVKSPRSRMQDPSWPRPGRGTQTLPGCHGRIWHLNLGFTIGKWRF